MDKIPNDTETHFDTVHIPQLRRRHKANTHLPIPTNAPACYNEMFPTSVLSASGSCPLRAKGLSSKLLSAAFQQAPLLSFFVFYFSLWTVI
ncbi:hypothetical protein, partial [Neglectibacter timonensis]|uniref:hypothetical protein n=1 Tax=Neglectibacter timonensis TaxID=1776382 RepID=UPI003AB60E0A